MSSPNYTSPTHDAANNYLDELLEDLPEQGFDDFQHDPSKQISKIKYLNMMICHTISCNDELNFMKLM